MIILDEILAAFHDKREVLELDGQNLTELPQQIGMLADLQVLSLSHNRLTRLPGEIGNLSKLVELAVDENCLTELPTQIGRLTRLEILLLSHNKLRAIPASIGDLANLHTLNLEHNELCTLSSEISKLTKLRRLNVQDNRLSELPEEFARIESLQDFDCNERKSVPPRNIRNFIAHGNPWIYPPAEMMNKQVHEIRDYLKGKSLDNPLLNGNGMNRHRWASPPSPDSPPDARNPPPCPVPPPLPRIIFSHLVRGAPYGYAFASILDVPARTEPQMEARLRKEFPWNKWQDHAEKSGEVCIRGISQNAPSGHLNVWIERKDSAGPFQLTVTISSKDQAEAEKVHHEVIRRLTWALIGWCPFPLPHFGPRPAADIDREEIINLPWLLEGPLITISDFKADILISRTLVEALSLHREVLKGWVGGGMPGDDPETRDALLRGNAACCLLRQSWSETASEDLQGSLALVRPAHTLLAELLELGLAQVAFYGPAGRAPGGRSVLPARIKVHYFGSSASYSAADGEASNLGQLLRLTPKS